MNALPARVLELAPPDELDSDVLMSPVAKLHRDLNQGIATLSGQEVRFLVDGYYSTQHYRIQAANQLRAVETGLPQKQYDEDDETAPIPEPHEVLSWHFKQMQAHENEIKKVLNAWTDVEPTGMGAWSKAVVGIGPVLAAGLLAHIDITKAPTVGHIWNFAGLNPNVTWEKGQKRPWNAALKVICWKIGQSFVKVSGNPNGLYGQLYKQRKQYEIEHNEAGDYAEQAARELTHKNYHDETAAKKFYLDGKLPPAHIQARAERWTVKIFLSHWHAEAYRRHYKTEPPAPYAIAILGHAHMIEPKSASTPIQVSEPN